MAVTDEDLREAAAHRGLKLVKSRKRKPGVGDYGLFGLTGADGKPLFGMSDDGLTATADQIIDFLRKGEASTWAASAKSVPDRPKGPIKKGPTAADAEEDNIPSAIAPRKSRSPARPAASPRPKRSEDTAEKGKVPPRPTDQEHAKSTSFERGDSDPSPEREPEAQSIPELLVRTAGPKDAEELQRLLSPVGNDIGQAGMKRAISTAASRKEPLLLAEQGSLIGCLAWHVVPSLLGGDTARITLLFIAEDERRKGVGRALYAFAQEQFRRRKLASVEAMSEIDLRNANGFLRAMGLKQASYRFVADL